MSVLRVLVVDDSLTVRRRLCEVLANDPGIEIVGEADNGRRAIEMCELLRPDIVTLDMVMPVMSGLSATEHIMAYRPTPILIISASLNRGALFSTYDALAAGAVDVLEKPTADVIDKAWEQRLITTVKLVARIKVITHLRARMSAVNHSRHCAHTTPEFISGSDGLSTRQYRLVAIGASTGGPNAIVKILKTLPPSLALPILFVMHIGEMFGAAFAEWLDGQTAHRVSYAEAGMMLGDLAGRVIMAPPGRHLSVVGNSLQLSDGAPRHSCRPSIDVLFESLAVACPSQVIACLLTGMGRDGATGMLALREAGSYTVAQDQATSVIFGMPREAVLLGAARVVLPLEDIGPHIQHIAQGNVRSVS
jgi:two-component system chemotaxis response regulator CheB